MPEVAFVCSRGQPASLRDLARTIAFELGLQDVDCTQHLQGFPAVRADRVYVLVDPPSYLAHEGEAALPDDAVLRRTVLLWTSPPPDPADRLRRALLERAGAVFALDARVQIALHRLRVPARLLRPGYCARLDRFGDPAATRPIDLLVCGEYSARRAGVLARSARILDRCDCIVALRDPEIPEDDATWALRSERLAAAKVVMNLHAGGTDRVDWREVLDAVHAGAAVASEHGSGISPFDAGEHLLVASAGALPFVADVLVRDAARRDRQRVAAYERLRRWIPFALPVSVLRAAVVELVGEPTPPDAGLGHLRTGDAPVAQPAAPVDPPVDLALAGVRTEAASIEIMRLSSDASPQRLDAVAADWCVVLGPDDGLLPRAVERLAAAVTALGPGAGEVDAIQPIVAVAQEQLLGWRSTAGETTAPADVCLPLVARTERLRECGELDEPGIRAAAGAGGWRIRRLPRIVATRP